MKFHVTLLMTAALFVSSLSLHASEKKSNSVGANTDQKQMRLLTAEEQKAQQEAEREAQRNAIKSKEKHEKHETKDRQLTGAGERSPNDEKTKHHKGPSSDLINSIYASARNLNPAYSPAAIIAAGLNVTNPDLQATANTQQVPSRQAAAHNGQSTPPANVSSSNIQGINNLDGSKHAMANQVVVVHKHEHEEVPPAVQRPSPLDPKLRIQAVMGLPDEIQTYLNLLDHHNYLFNNKIFVKHNIPNQLLLIGLPGTGKSILAIAIAEICGIPYLYFDAPSISNQWQNSGDLNIRKIFESAAEIGKPCLIIFDELNALTKKHDNKNSEDTNMLTILWRELDHCKGGNIFFIGIQNESSSSLPAPLKSRFGRHIITMPLPDKTKREKIIRFYIKRCDNVRFEQSIPARLAAQTKDFSNRDLEDTIKTAAAISYNAALEQLYIKAYQSKSKSNAKYFEKIPEAEKPLVTLQTCLKIAKEVAKETQKEKAEKDAKERAELAKYFAESYLPFINTGLSIGGQVLQYKMHNDQLSLTKELADRGYYQAERHHSASNCWALLSAIQNSNSSASGDRHAREGLEQGRESLDHQKRAFALDLAFKALGLLTQIPPTYVTKLFGW